jgi:Patatin-like phospholipase
MACETGQPIGAIGLCVTGGFALALTVGTDGAVIAPVMSEPALPAGPFLRGAVQLTKKEIAHLSKSDDRCVALRFKEDRLCTQERFNEYERILKFRDPSRSGSRLTRIEIAPDEDGFQFPEEAHSVLTEELSEAEGHPTYKAFGQVVQFLNTNLRTSGASRLQPTPSDRKGCFGDVLRDELALVLRLHVPGRQDDEKNEATDKDLLAAKDDAYEKRVLAAVDGTPTDLSALCLSGGGIRSATFALGVMQGLARYGLLDKFHYLSSVSGGGYIASWLSTWRSVASSDHEVFAALNQSLNTGKEPPQITDIRQDSNYLTPMLGLLSADTWTVIALYVRNLVLNWTIFGPFLLACFMVPRLLLAIFTSLIACSVSEKTYNILLALGAAAILFGLSYGVYGRFRKADRWLTDSRFQVSLR